MRRNDCEDGESVDDEEIIDEEATENDGIYFNVARGAWPLDVALTQGLDEVKAVYDAKLSQSVMRRSLRLMASSSSLVELKPLGRMGQCTEFHSRGILLQGRMLPCTTMERTSVGNSIAASVSWQTMKQGYGMVCKQYH